MISAGKTEFLLVAALLKGVPDLIRAAINVQLKEAWAKKE